MTASTSWIISAIAGMAELVDAADSKSAGGNTVGVRFPLPAPGRINFIGEVVCLGLVRVVAAFPLTKKISALRIARRWGGSHGLFEITTTLVPTHLHSFPDIQQRVTRNKGEQNNEAFNPRRRSRDSP